MKWYQVVGLTVMVLVTTLFIRIPVAGGGYFNLGDTMIVFTGLYAGRKVGLIAGGVGSAIADLIGFPLFAPITLIVKGVEGYLCGLGHKTSKPFEYLMPAVAVLVMVCGYFAGSALFPSLGIAVALTDLPINLIQAAVGYIGGRAIFLAFDRFVLPLT